MVHANADDGQRQVRACRTQRFDGTQDAFDIFVRLIDAGDMQEAFGSDRRADGGRLIEEIIHHIIHFLPSFGAESQGLHGFPEVFAHGHDDFRFAAYALHETGVQACRFDRSVLGQVTRPMLDDDIRDAVTSFEPEREKTLLLDDVQLYHIGHPSFAS